jgi:hypothetical protein
MPKTPAANTLCCGDNLDILQKYVADESGDLVDEAGGGEGVVCSLRSMPQSLRRRARCGAKTISRSKQISEIVR